MDKVFLYICNYCKGMPEMINYQLGDWQLSILKREDEKEIFGLLELNSGIGNIITHKVIVQKEMWRIV
ncbi:hypothetical protein HMSSN036_79350 [Paenibacillus macerans]|nr:hypothetical protein HMSSN036_79350 [Paenibacillus macerans]